MERKQAGIPYILDANAKALRIKSDCIIQLVTKIDGKQIHNRGKKRLRY